MQKNVHSLSLFLFLFASSLELWPGPSSSENMPTSNANPPFAGGGSLSGLRKHHKERLPRRSHPLRQNPTLPYKRTVCNNRHFGTVLLNNYKTYPIFFRGVLISFPFPFFFLFFFSSSSLCQGQHVQMCLAERGHSLLKEKAGRASTIPFLCFFPMSALDLHHSE